MEADRVREWLDFMTAKRSRELITFTEGFLIDLCQDWLQRFEVRGNDAAKMIALALVMRESEQLKRVGSMHAFWEAIHELEAFAAGRPTGYKWTAETLIAYGEKLLQNAGLPLPYPVEKPDAKGSDLGAEGREPA
jgi:hypothetical protein